MHNRSSDSPPLGFLKGLSSARARGSPADCQCVGRCDDARVRSIPAGDQAFAPSRGCVRRHRVSSGHAGESARIPRCIQPSDARVLPSSRAHVLRSSTRPHRTVCSFESSSVGLRSSARIADGTRRIHPALPCHMPAGGVRRSPSLAPAHRSEGWALQSQVTWSLPCQGCRAPTANRDIRSSGNQRHALRAGLSHATVRDSRVCCHRDVHSCDGLARSASASVRELLP